jgi:hypothetical protein
MQEKKAAGFACVTICIGVRSASCFSSKLLQTAYGYSSLFSTKSSTTSDSLAVTVLFIVSLFRVPDSGAGYKFLQLTVLSVSTQLLCCVLLRQILVSSPNAVQTRLTEHLADDLTI